MDAANFNLRYKKAKMLQSVALAIRDPFCEAPPAIAGGHVRRGPDSRSEPGPGYTSPSMPLLTSRAVIPRLLERLTARLPCRLIDGESGEPYLERYYLFGLAGWHVYLHRFVDSDPDRGLHDHPWGSAVSLVLAGGYDEIRAERGNPRRSRVRRVRPGRLNRLRGEDYHRVVLRDGIPAWTLFAHGPRVKGWGFFQGGEYRSMARDATEFRHRDWWKTAPTGAVARAGRVS